MAVKIKPIPRIRGILAQDFLLNHISCAENWHNVRNQFQAFNVLDYGAKGDGVADDTAAVQRAVSACYAAGGGTVVFPSGSYLISSIVLNWAASISIRFQGAGMQATKIVKYGSGTAPIFDLSADANILEAYSGIRGMYIDGRVNNVATHATVGVRLTRNAYFDTEDVYIAYCDIGIDNVGGLVNDFDGLKLHQNNTGFRARRSTTGSVYCNSVTFTSSKITGNRHLGLDYDQGMDVTFIGSDIEANGTPQNTFTVNAGTDVCTMSAGTWLPPTNTAVRASTTTTLPAASMTASTFTADASTDKITLTTDLDLPTGVKGRFTTTNTIPPGLSLLTDYWLYRVPFTTQYKVCTSMANAKAGTPVVADITGAGAGTHTFTPSPILIADIDYRLIKLSETTFKLATNSTNANGGTAIDLTDTGTGTHTITFVGTGGVILRANMDQEVAAIPYPTSGPGSSQFIMLGGHFEANVGRTFAIEKTFGLMFSMYGATFLADESSGGGCAFYIDGCRTFRATDVSITGPSEFAEITNYCGCSIIDGGVISRLTDNSQSPDHKNFSPGGSFLAGYSTPLHFYKNVALYFHQNVDPNIAHTIGNGGANRLTYTAGNSLGHIFAGGPVEASDFDGATLDLTTRLDIISPSSGGPTLALESTDTGGAGPLYGRRYTVASGGSAGGAFRTGHFDVRDSTLGAFAFGYGPNDGLQVFNRLQGAMSADVASASTITIGLGNLLYLTGTGTVNLITTTDWQAGAEIQIVWSATATLAHRGAATTGTAARINLSGSVNYVGVAGARMRLFYDGTDWYQASPVVVP